MRFGGLVLVALFAVELPIDGAHGCDCSEQPDSSYVVVTYDHPMPTPPTVTITPDGRGESFADKGITVTAVLRNFSNGLPCAGVPGQAIVLWNPGLCICVGGNTASSATDADGRTSFARIVGGGCAEFLTVFNSGVPIGTIPIRINSPDANAN